MTDTCPLHGQPWKTVPAGVSTKTGRPYNSFKACPVQGCDQRPPRTPRPNGQGSAILGQPSASQGPSQSDRDLVIMQACLAFASRLYAGTGEAGATDAKILAHEMYKNWRSSGEGK